jgi:DNA-binding NarL/FixJ family response regulator
MNTIPLQSAKTPSILVADPDAAARKALALILKHRFGAAQVGEAGDVETLLGRLGAAQPGLLLLDWTLYGALSPETYRLLRQAHPALHIILLSLHAGNAAAAQQAAAAFIHKGAAPEELIATLTPLLK